jgi:hypothetical protein
MSAETNKKPRKGGRHFFIHHFFSVLNFAFKIDTTGSSRIATHLPNCTAPYARRSTTKTNKQTNFMA